MVLRASILDFQKRLAFGRRRCSVVGDVGSLQCAKASVSVQRPHELGDQERRADADSCPPAQRQRRQQA
jgi:hypothetical protein